MTDHWEANEDKYMARCPYSGKYILPEDANKCNNGEGCDSCPHYDEEA